MARLYTTTGGSVHVVIPEESNAIPSALEVMQRAVGGYIECCHYHDLDGKHYVCLVDEEGLLKRKPLNTNRRLVDRLGFDPRVAGDVTAIHAGGGDRRGLLVAQHL